MSKMNSKHMRENPLFMRNRYKGTGRWGIPLVRKQGLPEREFKWLACSNARKIETRNASSIGIHFFVDDYRFEGVYNHPEKTLDKYLQYGVLLTPDFSTYSEMQPWRQLESVAKNRWCGAYWQDNAKDSIVIPTVSWSTPINYEFCFEGVEEHSIVAISTIGCKHSPREFMHGYDAMIDRLSPELIICVGKPFAKMKGNIYIVDDELARKAR